MASYEPRTNVFVKTGGDPVPFRVFMLANPTRLVVDIENEQHVG